MQDTSKNSRDKQRWFHLDETMSVAITDLKNIGGYLGVVFFLILNLCIFCLHSFGKQLGGRRGCECITLEPSEMIVVSYKHGVLETLIRQIYVVFTVTVITAANNNEKPIVLNWRFLCSLTSEDL